MEKLKRLVDANERAKLGKSRVAPGTLNRSGTTVQESRAAALLASDAEVTQSLAWQCFQLAGAKAKHLIGCRRGTIIKSGRTALLITGRPGYLALASATLSEKLDHHQSPTTVSTLVDKHIVKI